MRTRGLGEGELIREIRLLSKSERSPYGIGDDGALFLPERGRELVLTTDFLVEGVDFRPGDDWRLVGRKTLAVNLSDLAAMGARPRAALLYLASPRRPRPEMLKRFFAGWRALGSRYGVSLAGGDVSRAREWIAGAVLVGDRPRRTGFLRSGARSGDSLWVTGELGGSILGRHFSFEPRIRESLFLAENFSVTAAIDLSDGLGRDLPELLRASKKGARLDLDKIPVSRSARRLSEETGSSPLRHAFSDGEDFELLFTLPPEQDGRLRAIWPGKFSTPLSKIGRISSRRGIVCFREGREAPLPRTFLCGYEHWKKNG